MLCRDISTAEWSQAHARVSGFENLLPWYMKLGMLSIWLRKPQTSFQLALIQFKNVLLGFSPPLKTIKEKANPFSFFQNVLSNAHIWDNPVFIQSLPAVINFLYKCIHDDTCFLWSRPSVVCRKHFHSYSGWHLEVLRSSIYIHSHLCFGTRVRWLIRTEPNASLKEG